MFRSRLSASTFRLRLVRGGSRTKLPSVATPARRCFHFGTSEYAACFHNLPQPDPAFFREEAIKYVDSFDPQTWYSDPIASLLKGERLANGEMMDTLDALGRVNGKQIRANGNDLELIKEHIRTYQSPKRDLRDQIRQVEEDLFTYHSGYLIGNQCIDFAKQDGVTEIEEAVMANVVERRLNDMLLLEELLGHLSVNRSPIYVSCVSNFTNFLDLSRKTLRSLEVGIPVVILGRSASTAQHSFRWTTKLLELCKEQDVDPGMITFVSCEIDDLKEMLRANHEITGSLYATTSRVVASDIKGNYSKTIASTGGPNTMVIVSDPKLEEADQTGTRQLSPALEEAVRISAGIESSGQCTALRQCIVPQSATGLDQILTGLEKIDSASEAMKAGSFTGVFHHDATHGPPTPEYVHDTKSETYFKIQSALSPISDEYWRKVTVDFTPMSMSDPSVVSDLSDWLNSHQPISLAVNPTDRESQTHAYKVMFQLFEETSLVVYTVGGPGKTKSEDTESSELSQPDIAPALTCQARPQEGECFGEIPPRKEMMTYTRLPVVIPSSNPSYDTTYTASYLHKCDKSIKTASWSAPARALLEEISDDATRGYAKLLIDFLRRIESPRMGTSEQRTVFYGWQRPPLQQKTVVHCSGETTWDALAPLFFLFFVTNARTQLQVSIDPKNEALSSMFEKYELEFIAETSENMQSRVNLSPNSFFQALEVDQPFDAFPMLGQFCSLHLGFGHIKSTKANDQDFAFRARMSKKWIASLF